MDVGGRTTFQSVPACKISMRRRAEQAFVLQHERLASSKAAFAPLFLRSKPGKKDL